MRVLNLLLTFLLLVGFSTSVFGQWSESDSQTLVTKKIKLRMQFSAEDCVGGSLFDGGQTEVHCSVLMFEMPEAGQITDREFIGDEYFDLKVSYYDGNLVFEFRDYGIAYEDFLNEIINYYSENEVIYQVTYQGPDF